MSNPVMDSAFLYHTSNNKKSFASAKLFIVLFFLFSLFFTVDATIYLVFLI